jgi:hypothetical protein
MRFKTLNLIGVTGVLVLTLSAGAANALPVYGNVLSTNTACVNVQGNDKPTEKAVDQAKKPWKEHHREGQRARIFNLRDKLPGLLGLDAVQFRELLKSGKSISQIAEEKSIAKEELTAKLQSMMKADLEQAVTEQKISTEKAAQIESKLPQIIEHIVTKVHNRECSK